MIFSAFIWDRCLLCLEFFLGGDKYNILLKLQCPYVRSQLFGREGVMHSMVLNFIDKIPLKNKPLPMSDLPSKNSKKKSNLNNFNL